MMKETTMAMVTVAGLAAAAWGAVLTPADVKLEGMKLTIMPLHESVMIASLPVNSWPLGWRSRRPGRSRTTAR